MKLSTSEYARLVELLAKATGAGKEMGRAEADAAIMVAAGMLWDAPFRTRANELVRDINKEFDDFSHIL